MKQRIFSKKEILAVFMIILIVLLSLAALQFVDTFDNKYNAISQTNQENITIIDKEFVSFMVNGWELYPDILLNPDDFSDNKLSLQYTTWIGQYPNLSPFHDDGSPYGVATYRTFLSGDGITTMYLQEPLCATRIFVDGVEIEGNGNVLDYSPHIKDSVFSFFADEETELIIQTANYSHYYGGIWYPPAIGSADDIAHLFGSRLIFYGFLSFTSIAISVFCLSNWFGQKERDAISFYFGTLCLSFGIRVCYPFIRFIGVPLVSSLYALEDFTAMVGIYCALCISLLLLFENRLIQLKNIAKIISLGMCIFTVVFPLFVLQSFPNSTVLYGQIISWYKILMALFLIFIALYGCLGKHPHSKLILTAVTVNGVCILYGVTSLGQFEPIAGAWPEEYGAYCMVVCFVILMMKRNKKMVAENLHLTQNLQKEVETKTRHLKLLLVERGQLISELGHDMKSPLAAFSTMTQRIQLEDSKLDDYTKIRMQSMEHKCSVLAERLSVLQELTEESIISIKMDTFFLNELILDFYKINQPVVELDGPDFLHSVTSIPCRIYGNVENISRAIENLVYNSADFTPCDGNISLSLENHGTFASIIVTDTGCGILKENLSKVFDRHYTTRKDNGGQGLGLTIARFIILEHGGEITASSSPNKGSTFTIKLPLV